MGEIAEMMLDGTLCQHCGVIMDDMVPPKSWFKKHGNNSKVPYDKEPPGYPRSCAACADESQ